MTEKQYHSKNEANVQGKKKSVVHSSKGKAAKHIHFEQIDSTNTWAKMHIDQWADQGVTLVTASGQTAGRGRFKRRWESPPAVNIYATFCFWLDLQRADIGHIPQLLALAAAQVLEKREFSPTIKWPNDLLLQGKKIGGILCETVLEQGKRGIVCGIGLNVNMSQEALSQIDRPATSLLVERGQPFDVAAILDDLQRVFLLFLQEFIQKGFEPFFSLLQEKSSLRKGQMVRFHDNQTLIEAQFEAMHPDGSVELRLPDGSLRTYYAGEFLF
jgi:BirA family biotin operon repressor/biotin-[acetyl-CoA-carboxylase] ligase